MVNINQALLEEIDKNEAEITRRKDLLSFTTSESALLLDCKPFIESEIDYIVTKLYDIISDFEEIRVLLGDKTRIENLRRAQRKYIMDLFEGLYEVEYVKNRLRLGLVHQEIGLEPKFYISSMSQLKKILNKVIAARIEDPAKLNATRQALDKLLYFDTTLVLDTFILALIKKTESEKEGIALEAKRFEKKALHFKDLSQRDSLTNLYNHGTFQAFLKRDLLQAQRRHEALSLIYFDIDDFKGVNDIEGHAAGDALLKTIARILAEVCRKVDVLCRYGGDEFCVILPSCNLQDAERVCDRITETFRVSYPDISISFGISQTGPDYYESPEVLCLRTDQKMYEAKKKPGFCIFK